MLHACFSIQTTLTVLLKWWNIGLWINSLGILCLPEGRSSHNSFPLISGNVARLKEQHEVTCKQANPHSVSFWTSFEPILVMFRYENCSCLKFAYDTPGSEKSCRTPFNRRNYIHISFIKLWQNIREWFPWNTFRQDSGWVWPYVRDEKRFLQDIPRQRG